MASLYSLYGRREAGVLTDTSYWRATRDSSDLIQRLTQTRTLKGHCGCVNTIAWNCSGSKLISGSDDRHLKIYNASTGLELTSILTAHQSNIFSAKILPASDDAKVVSCAGIGSVEYTEVTPTGEFFNHPFQCHRSITYQVATTPGDRNEFMTCEEKGYVRLYDLRVKTECSCNGCTKDVLYHFPSSVSSIAVNPISPYYVAFGLGDGSVQVLDRRKPNSSLQQRDLTDISSEALHRMYSVSSLGRKITSVQFNQDGSQLLASYSEDYVYLFNSGLFGCGPGDTEIIRPSYMSQYECYSPAISRKRKSCVGVKVKHQDVSSHCKKEHSSPVKKLRLKGDWSDTGPEARPEAEASLSDGRRLMNHMSNMFSQWIDMPLQGREGGGGVRGGARGGRRRRLGGVRRTENSMGDGIAERDSESSLNSSASSDNSFELFEEADRSDVSNSGDGVLEARGIAAEGRESCSLETDARLSTAEGGEREGFFSLETDASTMQSVVEEKEGLKNTDEEGLGKAKLRNRDEASTDVASSDQRQESTPRPSPSPFITGDEASSSGDRSSSSREIPSIRVEDEVDSDTSDEVVSSKHKTESCDMSCDQVVNDDDNGDYAKRDMHASDSSIKPFMVYKGHRNSRTMIKQANFFGDNWVLSGSDCGRMFVWNKWTGEIVNTLLADSHVVNCVQPHPQSYLLATSGIDYDVKLWEPLNKELCSLQDISQIIERNNVMLEESRNTITMPSMIFLRVLAYLNRRRRERREGETD